MTSRWLELFLGRRSTTGLQLDSLDGLRGGAAIIVILTHLDHFGLPVVPFNAVTSYGKPSAFLFFSLSAFLLTLNFLNAGPVSTRESLLSYAIRRILRIYPLYILVLLLNWTTLSLWPGSQGTFLRSFELSDVASHLLLIAGEGHYWTIAVECQYYAILPGVAFVLGRLEDRPTLAVVGMLGIVAVIHFWAWPGQDYLANTLNLGPYLPVFLLGSLAAFLHRVIVQRGIEFGPRSRRVFEGLAFAILGVVLTLNGTYWYPEDNPLQQALRFANRYTLYGLLWCCFLVAHLHGTGLLRRAASWKPLRFVGAISFSLYLIHPTIIFALRGVIPGSITAGATAVIAALVLVSGASFLLIERRFLLLGVRLSRARATRA